MRNGKRPEPLRLAQLLQVPQRTVAARVDCSVSWLRVLGRDPRHTRRVLVAVLEAAAEREREALTLESMLGGNGEVRP